MKLNKRKLLRYRIMSWVVIVLITFQSGPMQVIGALADAAKMEPTSLGFVGHPMPVDLESGALLLTLEDLAFRNEELPLALNRIYRSDSDLKTRGLFGNRWHCMLDMHLVLAGDAISLIDEQGRKRTYQLTSKGFYVSRKWDYEELHIIQLNGGREYERKLKSGVSYLFDDSPDHLLTRIKDRNGRYLKIERADDSGTITVKDRYGRWIQVALKGGYVVAARDSLNRSMQYAYDVNGNLACVTTPAGGQYQFFYDSRSHIVRINIGTMRWYAFKYKNDYLIEQRSLAGLIASYQYDQKQDGLSVEVTDALNCKTKAFFNKSGEASVAAPDGTLSRLFKNSRDLPVKVEYSTGEQVEIEYDSYYNIVRVIQNGTETKIQYNNQNLLEAYELSDGEVAKMEYDLRGNVVRIMDSCGASTALTWNESGQITQVDHPDGKSVVLTYDQYGLPRSITDNTSGKYSFIFDPSGLMNSCESPTGVKTSLKYNAAGQPIIIENSEGQRIDIINDNYGNIKEIRDSGGGSAKFSYDAMGMISGSVDPLGGSTQFEWMPDGKAKSFTDSAENTTAWGYDKFGRLESEMDAGGAVRKILYNATGKLSGFVNARGQSTRFGYNDKGHLNSVISESEKSAFDYDHAGRMIMMKNAHSEYRMAFGAKGEIESVNDCILDKKVAYTYDSLGRRSRMTTPDGIVSYSYDEIGRIREIKKNGQSVVFSYDPFGRRSKMTFSNGVSTAYSYDKLNRVISIASENVRKEILTSVIYEYDQLDRVVRTVDEKGIEKKYQYDAKSQLIKVVQGESSTEYIYDLAGNRTAVIRDGKKTECRIGKNNQLLSSGDESYQYDADGNLISRQTPDGNNYTYTYDEANRMRSAQGPQGEVAYKYAPNGIRIARETAEKEIRYLFDAGDIISEVSGGKTEAEYLHGPGIDEWLTVERGGSLFSCHADRMGSVLAHSDSAGTLTKSFSFDEFGNPANEIKGESSLMSYTGREWDTQADMHYYRARFYSPANGRFNSLDPFGLSQGQNQYTYVKNSPLSFKDPNGRVLITATVLTAVAVSAVAGGLLDLGWQGISNWRNDRDFFHEISGWSIAGSTLLGALAPVIAAMAAPGAAAAGVVGAIITRLAPLGPALATAVMSAVSAALVGTLEYFAKTPWKDIRIFDFISHVTNRAVSYIFGNQFGRWISGIRFNPRHVINEIYSQVIAAPVAYVYNLVAERIFPAPAGGGSGPGSGGPAPPGGGSGGWESRGGSAGGGDSDEYKRFQRFENWSN